MSNVTSYVYLALNGYGVTVIDIIVNVVVVVIAAWIIGLNIIVLHTLHNKTDKDPSEYYIINLSIADLLTGVYLIYNTVYNLTNFKILTECLVRFGYGMGVTICSVFQLVLLSGDRYIKIIAPYRYTDLCGRVTIIIASTVSWFVALAIGMLPLFGWATDTTSCSYIKVMAKDYLQLLVAVFLIPFFLLLLIYLRIFKEAHRHAKAINDSNPEGRSNTINHSLKFTKTVFIVAGTYIICWAPTGLVLGLHINGSLDGYTHVQKGNFVVYATALAYINSLLNPIIYAFKIPTIRKRFQRVFCRKKRGTVTAISSIKTSY